MAIVISVAMVIVLLPVSKCGYLSGELFVSFPVLDNVEDVVHHRQIIAVLFCLLHEQRFELFDRFEMFWRVFTWEI